MAELVPDDILEKIMIGLDVKYLIRCKCVCKSWHSFVTSSRFVKAHLNHSYNNDRNNNDFGHRRIVIPRLVIDGKYKFYHGVDGSFIGSSNGLVCISPSHAQVLVANPSTREVKKLENLVIPHFVSWSCLCWGFGYDKSTDDYKVIVGFYLSNCRTRFQVLSLKLNVWKLVREVNYTYNYNWRKIGTYCNGALHWFMKEQNNNEVIISFDLSQEKFKEIPTSSVDAGNEYNYTLGIFKGCLCIYRPYNNQGWVMKNYNVKESWERLSFLPEKDNDVVHYMKTLEHHIPQTSFFIHDCISDYRSWNIMCAPIFVQSLVSPHLQETKEKDRHLHQ